MRTNLDRFKKRRKLKNTITTYSDVDKKLVNELLDSEVNQEEIDNIHEILSEYYNISVSEEEVTDFLEKFKKDFNDQRFKRLVTDCQKEVINNIVIPFGLGKIVAAYDKTGGNVDTIHNVREGIYASEDERHRYENRGKYDSDKYHKDPNYIDINRQKSNEKKNGKLKDYMTDNKIRENESYDLDHVKSAKEIHDDQGRILAEIDGPELANTESNLKATSATNNRSKKADSMDDFLARKNERIKKIDTLKSKDNLSESELKELSKLEKLKEIDDKKAIEIDTEAREEIDNTINGKYYRSDKFVQNVTHEGLKEGAKMGMQQTIGLVLVEFFTALFDEIIDIYKNGFDNGFKEDKFLSILTSRLKRIGERIASKWKDVAIAFKDGAISGFISNIITTLTNAFVTTAKRTVRIIREGIFSLYRAVKLLLFPPEGMTFSDAMHEAKKLIASGIIISIGVLIEEYVDAMIQTMAFLKPFADIMTSILIGSITGLTVILVAYYIDKKKNDKDLFNNLVCDTDKKLEAFNKLLLFDNAIPEVSKILIST